MDKAEGCWKHHRFLLIDVADGKALRCIIDKLANSEKPSVQDESSSETYSWFRRKIFVDLRAEHESASSSCSTEGVVREPAIAFCTTDAV